MINLNQVLKTQDARKIFGKKEIEIILNQLEGIPLSQSEKNRLSRDIKPKFNFIKRISAFQNQFSLKKNQKNRALIEDAIAKILADEKRDSIRAIFLFGSFADRSYTRHSDIDIAVLFKIITLQDATRFRIRILGQLTDKIDMQVFNTLPKKIKKEIARNHRMLYKNPSFDNTSFSLQQTKDDGSNFRVHYIFGAHA